MTIDFTQAFAEPTAVKMTTVGGPDHLDGTGSMDDGGPLISLRSLLDEPDEPVTYRIDRLLPTGGRAMFAAQFKAGKTTSVGNVLRSVADSTPFLGEFGVTPLGDGETVALIDDEMSRGQIRRWLRDQGIEHTERVYVAALRGQVAAFNLLDPDVRAEWAADLRRVGARVLVFDCLRPVLDALGLEESRDAGKFLVQFDALLTEAGICEAVVVHHMGHHGERARGDSRLRDWPDVEWRLVRQTEAGEEPDPAAPRFFSAYGRDVDVTEGALTYDPVTRHLTYTGGSRKEARKAQQTVNLRPFIIEAVVANPGIGAAALVEVLRRADGAPSFRDREVSQVARGLAEENILRIEDGGPGRAKRHYYVTPSNPVQPRPTSSLDALPLTPSTPSIGDGVGVGGASQPNLPTPSTGRGTAESEGTST